MPEVKGILGEKLGMTQLFEDARAVPVTVIKAGPCHVAQVKSVERDGYQAVQIAFAEPRRSGNGRLTKPMEGHFAAHGDEPGRYVVELRTDDAANYQPGQELKADLFAAGEYADVIGVSRGKGFAGTMKRHNFSGQGASHGNHKHHRAPGSIGSCSFPGRVFKGLKMSGQMGHQQVTTLNLEVVESDVERNVLLVRGSVPGPNGGVISVRNAVKSASPKGA
jgi:large subunit ribosomal protein L3